MIAKIAIFPLKLLLKIIMIILKVILMIMPMIAPIIMPISPIILLVVVYNIYKKPIGENANKYIKPVICSTIGSVPIVKNLFPFCALPDSEKVNTWEMCPLEKNEQCRVEGDSCNRTRRNGHYMCCPSTFLCTPFSGGECKAGYWYCNNSNKHNGYDGKNKDSPRNID
tara:strand:- start:388 stop:891 length:504 start_codon:yes stop_codon:yes gene_type:complete